MNYAHRYEGRRALVTGGGSGMSQATVLRLLAEGGSVVAADVSEPGLKDTVEKAGAHAERLTTLVVDIADETSVREGSGPRRRRWAASTSWSTRPASCVPRTPGRPAWRTSPGSSR